MVILLALLCVWSVLHILHVRVRMDVSTQVHVEILVNKTRTGTRSDYGHDTAVSTPRALVLIFVREVASALDACTPGHEQLGLGCEP